MSSPQLENGRVVDGRNVGVNYPIPVSNGIFDHREKVGSAIWLFLLLVDWTTVEQDGLGQVLGGKPVTTTKLKEVLRLEERQVRSQLQRLQSIGFIRLRRTSYGFVIEVLKSKKFIFRDRKKVAALPLPDRQETSDQNPQIGNYSPLRSAINCRNKEDYTEETKKERVKDKPSPDPSLSSISEKTIRRLNELSGKSYRPESKAVNQYLLARLKDGATEAEILAVVQDRWERWKTKPEMLEHFNPVTLFRPSNFERYLTEAKSRNGNGPMTEEERQEWRRRTFVNAE